MLNINPNRNVTKGYLRGSIIDSSGCFKLVPLDFLNYLIEKTKNLKVFNKNSEYEEFILEERFLIPHVEIHNEKWDSYSKIEHVSVELKDLKFLDCVVDFALEVICQTLEINLNFSIDELEFNKFLDKIKTLDSRVSIFLETFNFSDKIISKINKIENLINVFCSEYFSAISSNEPITNGGKFQVKIMDNFESNCQIHIYPNHNLVLESKNVHNFYYKKLFINKLGEILRFEEDWIRFGHISDKNIMQKISNAKFKQFWYVKKDNIDICQLCEFRHICVDFRLPIKRKINEYYHLSECVYNPFIGKWEGQVGYKNLAECGVSSDGRGISINHQRIAQINKEIWA